MELTYNVAFCWLWRLLTRY